MSIGDIIDREERPAYVRFERRPVENKAESIKQGRYVAIDVDYALVTPPYSKDCVVHKVQNWLDNVRRNVKDGRTPQSWLDQWEKAYHAWKNGQEVPLNGTPIRGWGVISPAQQEMLIGISIRTVEDLAGVNDEGTRRIGIGAIDMKNKAVAWLNSMKNHGAVTVEMAALKQENETLRASLDGLKGQVESLKAMIPQTPQYINQSQSNEITASDLMDDTPIISEPSIQPKRRGRPPRQAEQVI